MAGRPPPGPSRPQQQSASASREPWEIDPSTITLSRSGRGGFGIVHKARWAGQKVAVKKLVNSAAMNAETREEFKQEARLLSVLRHPNIINFFGACVSDPQNMMIVTEYCHGGNLFDYIRNNQLVMERKLEILRDVACGMLYLLNYRNPPILHRDLKSPNVLLARDGTAKLCDFGYARVKTEAMRLSGILGTPQWMAPEVLKGELNATEKSDVFSFGVIMWEVAGNTARMPWEGVGPHQIVKRVVKGERLPITPDHDPWLAQLIPRCWKADPRERPSFRELSELIQGRLDELTGRQSFGPGPGFSPADKYSPGNSTWSPASKLTTPDRKLSVPSFGTPVQGSPLRGGPSTFRNDTFSACLPNFLAEKVGLTSSGLKTMGLGGLCTSSCLDGLRDKLEEFLSAEDHGRSKPTSAHSSSSSVAEPAQEQTQRWIGYTKRPPRIVPPPHLQK
eukprot:tig00020961_g16715.t1